MHCLGYQQMMMMLGSRVCLFESVYGTKKFGRWSSRLHICRRTESVDRMPWVRSLHVECRDCQTEAECLEEKKSSKTGDPDTLVLEDPVDQLVFASLFVQDFDGFIRGGSSRVKTGKFFSRQVIRVEIMIATDVNGVSSPGKLRGTVQATAFKLYLKEWKLKENESVGVNRSGA